MTTPTNPSQPEIDVEDFVTAWLMEWNIVPAAQISARLPAQLPLPYILVQRIAGGDDYITDSATIQVDSFAITQTAASDIAREVNHAMHCLSPKTIVVVNGVQTSMNHIEFEQTPIFLDFEDPVVFRYVARYVIDVRIPLISNF